MAEINIDIVLRQRCRLPGSAILRKHNLKTPVISTIEVKNLLRIVKLYGNSYKAQGGVWYRPIFMIWYINRGMSFLHMYFPTIMLRIRLLATDHWTIIVQLQMHRVDVSFQMHRRIVSFQARRTAVSSQTFRTMLPIQMLTI